MAIGVPVDWSLQRMNPLLSGGYYPGDIRDQPPAPMRGLAAAAAEGPGLYFPSIAELVGRGQPTLGPGIAVPTEPRVIGRELPPGMAPPTDYFPSIARNIGGGLGPPVGSSQPPGPPSPSQADIGPGIPLAPSPQITSQDIGPGPSNAPMAMPGPGGSYNPRDVFTALTAPGPPPSRRYSSTRPEFIFTNPASAQQAAANYAARLGYEQNQDQGFRQYQAQLAAEREATQRSAQATEAARLNEATRLAAIQHEGAANRASSERIASMSEAWRRYQLAEQQWARNEQVWRAAQAAADSKNNAPNDPNLKVDMRLLELGKDGKYHPNRAYTPYPRPTPPAFPAPGEPGYSPSIIRPEPQPAVPTEEQPPAGGGVAIPTAPEPSPLPWWRRLGVDLTGPYVQLYP